MSWIITVGAGKGGVGKSFFSSALALYFARKGEQTLLSDLDLGGCNLHTWLGISPFSPHSLDQIFTERQKAVELFQPTFEPSLFFLQGPSQYLLAPNLKYSQKKKLIQSLKKLPFPRVIADLGAGAHFNVIDFFLLGNIGILVVTPERTSIENAHRFLKVALIRRLFPPGEEKGDPSIIREIAHLIASARTGEILRSPEGRSWFLSRTQGIRVGVVVNQVEKKEGRNLGREIAGAISHYLLLPTLHLGDLPFLPEMRKLLNQSSLPLKELFEIPELEGAISAIAEEVSRFLLSDLPEEMERGGFVL